MSTDLYFAIFAIIFIIVSTTSYWVYNDAEKYKISANGEQYGTNNGAMAWMLSCLLLWPVNFPHYLYVRSYVKKYKKMLDAGLITIEDYERKKSVLIVKAPD